MIDGAAFSFPVPKNISAAPPGSIWLTSSACLSTAVQKNCVHACCQRSGPVVLAEIEDVIELQALETQVVSTLGWSGSH